MKIWIDTICVHLSFVLIRLYLRYKKDPSGFDFIELKLGNFCY